jgi:lipopolysaccharide/colanic/teichoic acid biosynthesis glycosyltransferase
VFVFSWLFPIIAIIIKLNSKGPVFFKQKRSGLDNDNFGCYKFRSMYFDEKRDGVQATKGDSRITTVGAFLRKTSLDELPQFLNVLLGQMSVVGPRPHPLWLNDKYRDNIEKYMLRHFIKPGITGLAQVKGFRGETTDPVMMERRIKMDVFYLENWSFLLDIKIIFMTVFGFLKGDENAF